MSSVLLSFDDVHYTPPGAATILSSFNLALGRGEHLVLLASDARVRETIALLAAGLVRPERGQVERGRPAGVEGGGPPVGLVFPVPGQGLIAATVLEEVGISLAWQGLAEDEIAPRAASILDRFGLWERRQQAPSTLSGGEKQRLALAAALAAAPTCLVLVEPVAMLDPAGAKTVVAAVREVAGEDLGILWLTGDVAWALQADRVAIYGAGRIVWSGAAATALTDPALDLVSWNLSPFPLMRLKQALVERGLPVTGSGLTPEALVEEICSVWPRSASRTNRACPPSSQP